MIIKLFNGQAGKQKKGEMFMFLSDIKKKIKHAILDYAEMEKHFHFNLFNHNIIVIIPWLTV